MDTVCIVIPFNDNAVTFDRPKSKIAMLYKYFSLTKFEVIFRRVAKANHETHHVNFKRVAEGAVGLKRGG